MKQKNSPNWLTSLAVAMSLLFIGVGCGGSGTSTTNPANPTPSQSGESYVPFNPANLANQVLRVLVYQDFADGRGSPTSSFFDEFLIDYIGGLETTYGDHQLQTKVVGREDDHTYATLDQPELGAELDKIINDAVVLGSADTDGSSLQKDMGHVIDKTLLRFFYLSIYHEMFKGINKTQELFAAGETTDGNETAEGPKNWDEAFGYFGLAENGEDFCRGVCATVEKRVENFPDTFTGFKEEIFQALIRGKAALVAGDFATALEQRDFVDSQLLFLFAVSCARELHDYQTADTSDKKATKLVEARIFVDILNPFIRSQSGGDADFLRALVNTYDLEGNLRTDVDDGITAGLISNADAQLALEVLEDHFVFQYDQL